MRPANRISIHKCALFCSVLTVSLIFFSCSSKKKEDANDQSVTSPVTTQNTTHVASNELELLKRENEELKKSLAKSLELEKEVKRLRLQNENSIKAITEIIALLEKSKIVKQENVEMKQAINKLIALEKQNKKTESLKDTTDDLIKQFESKVSAEEKLKFLQSLSDLASLHDLSVIGVVRKALDDPNPEIGRAAIELLDDYPNPEILPVVEHALSLADEQIRSDALETLSGVSDPYTGTLLVQALNDTSKNIRVSALKIAREKNDAVQLEVLAKGISSAHDDVKFTSAWLLQERSDHKGMDIIIEGLKDSDPAFREEINETLNFLINREFSSYDEAKTWWEQNKNKYDEDLFEKDDM